MAILPKRLPVLLQVTCLAGLLATVPVTSVAATQERPDDTLRQILTAAIESSDSFDDRFDAEVWLTDMSNRLTTRVQDPEERLTILKTVHYEARRARLEPELVLAVINVESNYDRFAISSAGARGLMQIMPFWLDEIGHPEDNLFHIKTNIRFGCTILSYYLKRENGDMYRALARYNGSVGKRWYPNRVYSALSSRWYKQ
ncbi:MAG: lytic transglycosylase domain-containing protein [Gammaproteobacteria bacterium]|nr:lytic transglycosylase domain-containing protein [Gammaproteobacteria bacterium]